MEIAWFLDNSARVFDTTGSFIFELFVLQFTSSSMTTSEHYADLFSLC